MANSKLRWRMAAMLMLQNVGNARTRLTDGPIWMKLGWKHPIVATAHWTFSSYGRLEAERVNQFWQNLVHNSKLGPQWQAIRSNIKFLKLKMADRCHVGKYWKCHNSPPNGPNGTKLGRSHAITFPTCPSWCGCHGNGCCLATAHWTFSSCACLETKRMKQFWWNLVHNSKLRPQRQSCDQILKFSKFKMADGRHVGKYW